MTMILSRPYVPTLLILALLLGAGPGPSASETGPTELPVAEPLPDEESEPSSEEKARRLAGATKAFETFHRAVMEGDQDTAWRYLSSLEKKDLYGDDPEAFEKELTALRENEEEWILFTSMKLVEIELDEDDPVYAYATVTYQDADGYEDEDEVDLVLQSGRWRVEGYF